MTLEAITFWALGALLLASALMVVLTKNLFHSVLYLALSLTSMAGIFLALDAEFLAAVQLLLYAGGVVVLVVFAIMLTERIVGQRIPQASHGLINGAIVATAVFVGVAGFLLQAGPAPAEKPSGGDTTVALGRAFLGPYAVPLELLGALYFARED